jgi:Gpi18-like mannosyltransferase
MYPPGWPAVLAVGLLAGLDWLLNPLLGLCILWLTYRIAILVFDQRVGQLAVILMVMSPFFLFNSVGFMAHPLGGAMLAAATLFLFHGLKSRGLGHPFGTLLLAGLALLVRPWTAFCVGTVLGATAYGQCDVSVVVC